MTDDYDSEDARRERSNEVARRAYRGATGQTARDEITKLRAALVEALDSWESLVESEFGGTSRMATAPMARIAELRKLVSE